MQIEKLRLRLLNAGKNTTEYRMTIAEAKALLLEIDELKKALEVKPKTITKVVYPPADNSPKIWDGGSLV
jgi:hypothetical protein